MSSSEVVSDAEINKAFENTNFGTTNYREILHIAVLKKACGHHCGHTITTIMKELKLIGSDGLPIKRGRLLMRKAFHELMINGA